MKRILLTLTLTLSIGGLSTFAETDTSGHGRYRFAKIEATENSWDHTFIIYTISDATGHEVSVSPSQISYTVRDKSGNDISAGKGVYVTIPDTRMESEEDYSITVTASIQKEKIAKTFYKKASPKKLILKQQGYSFSYKMMRPRYSSPSDYEALNINASSMSVEVAFAGCRDCATFKLSGNAGHATLTDAASYREFESTIYSLAHDGKKVQVMLQPTVIQKGGTIRYAQSFFEVSPDALRELSAEPAMAADKEIGGEE